MHDVGDHACARPEPYLGRGLSGRAELPDARRPAERERAAAKRRALRLDRDVAEHAQVARDHAATGDLEVATELDLRGLQRAHHEPDGLCERVVERARTQRDRERRLVEAAPGAVPASTAISSVTASRSAVAGSAPSASTCSAAYAAACLSARAASPK